jgi:glutamate racemase
MLKKASNPIGIFDSGMGGLTVAKAVAQYLPQEEIVYFGDTAHTPWGDKSTRVIQSYAIKICDVLLEQQCKIILIACHTASAAAYEAVTHYIGDKALVLNVIDPVIEHIDRHHAHKKIGLIGTKQTVRSNTYNKRIEALNRNIHFNALATPLLVPLIEEGFAEKNVSATIVQEYLSHPDLADIEALILGCTHYPLLKAYIQNFYNNKVDIIDTSEMTARILKEALELNALLNTNNTVQNTKKTFYVSDVNEFFERAAKLFFSGDIVLKHYPLLD